MRSKKFIFGFSLLSVFACSAVSCGSGIMHEVSATLKAHMADVINHDGQAEDNLTWSEAYDALIKEANSIKDLNKIADAFGIDKNEPHRTSLARYEILHEAEELLMNTGAMVPLYNYADPYLMKPNVDGLYWSPLGYKFFDRLKTDNVGGKDYDVCVGTKAETFDPGANSDASTGLILENILVGAKKYRRSEQAHNRVGEDPEAYIGEGVCDVICRHVTSDTEKAQQEDWVYFGDCPDLADENPEDYENTARYTITVKPKATWSDEGDRISAFDFTYAWDRASSNTYSSTAFGIWSSLFDSIRGYDAWNLIGQQETDDVSKWDSKLIEKLDKLGEEEKAKYIALWKQAYNHPLRKNKTRGGLPGVIPVDDYTFEVQLINDSEYFSDLLAFTAFMPVPTKHIITEKDEQGRAIKENPTWWNNKNTFPTDGPFKIENINNIESGSIKVSKNERWMNANETTTNTVEFRMLDDDSTAYSIYKSNEMQMIDMVAQGVLDQVIGTPDWHAVNQIGLYYALFNVNDNTFDVRENVTEAERAKYRRILNLLIDRYHICKNIVKSGATPANGVVTTGITEKYIPTWDENKTHPITGEKGAIVALKNPDGTYVSKDWHERNADMYSHLNSHDTEFAKWRLDKRDAHQHDKYPSGGFYAIGNNKEEEAEALKTNINEAIKLASELGINWVVDGPDYIEDGHFDHFPQISLITNTGTGHESLFESMQNYYSLFGIQLSIETQEWNAFTAAKRRGAFAMARNGWLADYADPRTYLDLFRATDGNNDTQLGKNTQHRSR